MAGVGRSPAANAEPVLVESTGDSRRRRICSLTGRGDNMDRTKALIDAVLSRVLGCDDRLIDIGCGDGRFLDIVADKVAFAVGTVPTEEERARLASFHKRRPIVFQAGRVEDLRYEGPPFDIITLNGVLQLLGNEARVRRALSRIAAIAAPGARLYVGELPQAGLPRKIHSSTGRAIIYMLRQHGFCAALVFLRHLWRRRHRFGRYEKPRLQIFSAASDDFVALVTSSGFALQKTWDTVEVTGEAWDRLAQRQDYLFVFRR